MGLDSLPVRPERACAGGPRNPRKVWMRREFAVCALVLIAAAYCYQARGWHQKSPSGLTRPLAARWAATVGANGSGLLAARAALAADPAETMRNFCRSDGLGHRLHPQTWGNVEPAVTWKLEPAWDRVVLISGYEVGPPQVAGDAVAFTVTYSVTADVRPAAVTDESRQETRTYRLVKDPNESWWRVLGPPPPPHVFASRVDASDLAASLDPRAERFLSASAFVWQLWTSAGWTIPYADTAALPSLDRLAAVERGTTGDLVVYFDGDTPYHVGMVEGDGIVVSATLNAGVRRAPTHAFFGETRYFRLRAAAESTAGAAATPEPTRHPRTPRTRAPTPRHRHRTHGDAR